MAEEQVATVESPEVPSVVEATPETQPAGDEPAKKTDEQPPEGDEQPQQNNRFEERRKQSRLQKRFDTFTREIRTLQARIESMQQQGVASSAQGQPAPVQQPQYQPPQQSFDPNEGNFVESIEAAKADYPDYDETINKAQRIPVSPALSQAIRSSDMAGDVMYYLAKNPTEAIDLNYLDAFGVAREIGRIEARIESQKRSAPAPKPVSKAPPPVKPVAGGAESVTVDPNTAGMDYHMNALQTKRKLKYGK